MITDAKRNMRYRSLSARHRRIDEMILAEQRRHWPDELAIQHLKKRKLEIKDRLYRLRAQ